MQNPIQKFRQSSIFFEKPGIFSWKLKTLTSSNYHRVQFFCWNFTHVSYLAMSKKNVRDFFFCFGYILSNLQKLDLISTHSFFYIFGNNSRSKWNKKYTKHPFVDIVKYETCAKFYHQSFQFFIQITWFLGNNRALSKFRYRILHNLISIIKL